MGPTALSSSSRRKNQFLLSGNSLSRIIEEGSLDGNHLVVTCTLTDSTNKIRTHVLIDCGATGYAFIDENFTCHHQLPLHKLKTPHDLEVIDGCPISSGTITHMAKAQLTISNHYEQLPIFVTRLGYYPLVLGIP